MVGAKVLSELNSYSHWGAAILMIAVSTLFVFGFIPLRKRNWKALGITEAFIIALYTEMYGFPLTIYLLSGFLGIQLPAFHLKGHLWATLLGLGEGGAIVEMLIGDFITLLGAGLVTTGWRKIYKARSEDLVTSGAYSRMRHPQYTGIILATVGTFVHWPTLPTLLMLPILIASYYHLAKKEEKEMEAKFGEVYQKYKKRVPMFLPKVKDASYKCPECRFLYKEKKWAEKCEAWCRMYRSCNLEITKHAVKKGGEKG